MSTRKKPSRSWQDIAGEASRERDPGKLLELTRELEQALDERDKVKPPQAERPHVSKRSSGAGH